MALALKTPDCDMVVAPETPIESLANDTTGVTLVNERDIPCGGPNGRANRTCTRSTRLEESSPLAGST